MSVEKLLEGEIEKRLENLEDVDAGTDEYKAQVDGVTKLIDRKIELDKLEIERIDKIENQKIEHDLKMRQIKEEKTSRLTRDIITAATFVGGAVLSVWGFIASTNFEREGTFTTTAGRQCAKRVLSIFK